AHGKGMAAGFQVWRQRFVVLAADESITTASGCSIDDAFRFLQRIGSDSGVDLMDRKTVVYVAGNEDVAVPLSQCWAQRKAEIINDNTLVYNTLIDTLGALRSGFPCRFGDTWLAEMWK
ncbi:MAG: hypothetical protein JNM00_16645, partial [Flavobacteriales bacterium]|nr:hypothetical protein [Flavobacteriales bacterium]